MWKLIILTMAMSDTGSITSSSAVVDNLVQEDTCRRLEQRLTKFRTIEVLGRKTAIDVQATCELDAVKIVEAPSPVYRYGSAR